MSHDVRRRFEARNLLHTILLILGMAVIMALLGYSLFGVTGLVWALIGGIALLMFGQRVSPKLVMRLYKAKPIARDQSPRLYQIMDQLAERAGLPKTPQVYHVPSKMMNAFAVGKQHNAAIGITDGLMRGLNLRELTAVLAHEVSHVDHNDMWVMGFADVISRITHVFSSIGKFLLFINLPLLLLGRPAIPWMGVIMLLIAPMLVSLMQLALSRAREYDADSGAVELTGDAEGLASALKKLEMQQGGMMNQILKHGDRVPNPSIFRTHPKTEDRLDRLRGMAGLPELQREEAVFEPALIPAHFAQITQRPKWRLASGLWY